MKNGHSTVFEEQTNSLIFRRTLKYFTYRDKPAFWRLNSVDIYELN